MKANEATWDRALRILIGVIALSFVVVGPKSSWGLLGLIPFVTGFVGYCPLYQVFGVTTCANKTAR